MLNSQTIALHEKTRVEMQMSPSVWALMYRPNFLHYILQQNKSFLLYSMLKAQEDKFVKGDWFSDILWKSLI